MHDGHGCWALQEAFTVGLRAKRRAKGSRIQGEKHEKQTATACEARTHELIRTRFAGVQVFTFSPSFSECFSLPLWADMASGTKAVGVAGLRRSRFGANENHVSEN